LVLFIGRRGARASEYFSVRLTLVCLDVTRRSAIHLISTIAAAPTHCELRAIANDLNPVAAAILAATVKFPAEFGEAIVSEFHSVGVEFRRRIIPKVRWMFPQRNAPKQLDATYLWARTICCPYCSGQIPLSPNWRLNSSGLGVRLIPGIGGSPGKNERICTFEIVNESGSQSAGTVTGGDATCPFPDCARVIDGDEVKRQAQAEGMGEQLFAVVYQRQIETRLKSGKLGKPKWERSYSAPDPDDNNSSEISARLEEKLLDWEALDVVPNEPYEEMFADRSKIYGVNFWKDLFNKRQLLGHCFATEVFREMVDQDRSNGHLSEIRRAAYVYRYWPGCPTAAG
jgi:putative DNA methylase